MHIRLFIIISLLAVAGHSFAQAYKWTDENGVVHYSDRPQPGAEEFVLPHTNRPTPIVRPRANAPAVNTAENADEKAAEPEPGYESLEIISPVAEETQWNIQGNLAVQVTLRPALKRGHQMQVYLDGQPRPVTATNFTLTDVFRGEHSLQVEVLNENNELEIRSEPVIFYVQQTTIVGANNPSAVPR